MRESPRTSTDVIGLTQDQIWDDEAAQSYDTPGEGMFADDLLGATVERLAALADGGPALELAVGTGRVAIPLAARGVPVTGIELSAAMVRRLREKADESTLPVVLGDMTTATAGDHGSFAVAYLVFNTISNVLTQDGQVEVFRNAARHLRPGGRFVVELEVPQLRHLTPGQDAVVFTNEPGYLGVDSYDVVHQILVSHHVRYGESHEARISRSPHRWIWPSEMDLMARLAGFALESRDADWTGTPFTADSPSHVSVYRLTGAVSRRARRSGAAAPAARRSAAGR